MTALSLLLSAVLAATSHRPPHLMRPATHPALHKRFKWLTVQTRTWRGKVHVDMGLLERYRWILEANGR